MLDLAAPIGLLVGLLMIGLGTYLMFGVGALVALAGLAAVFGVMLVSN